MCNSLLKGAESILTIGPPPFPESVPRKILSLSWSSNNRNTETNHYITPASCFGCCSDSFVFRAVLLLLVVDNYRTWKWAWSTRRWSARIKSWWRAYQKVNSVLVCQEGPSLFGAELGFTDDELLGIMLGIKLGNSDQNLGWSLVYQRWFAWFHTWWRTKDIW